MNPRPPQPNLREGFVQTSGWELVRGVAPEFAVSQPHIDNFAGWILWIAKSGAHPLPIHALSSADQAEVDRLAFNVCRRIDQALGLPVKK